MTGMDQVDCVHLDEIVLEQSGCSMISGSASPRGSPTGIAPPNRDAMGGFELGAAAAAGASANAAGQANATGGAAGGVEKWTLGTMPVRPGAGHHVSVLVAVCLRRTWFIACLFWCLSVSELTCGVCLCVGCSSLRWAGQARREVRHR